MSSEPQILLTVLIPFHHESQTIAEVLTKLQEHLKTVDHETLLVHDDTNDPTLAVIKTIQHTYPQINVLLNAHKPGVPGALKTGLGNARGAYIVFLVADDPSPAPLIVPMLNLLEQGQDVVSLSRYTKGGKAQQGDACSRFLSALANRLFVLLTGSKQSDITCGIKMFRKSILEKIVLKSDADWTLPFELAVRAQSQGFKTTELPFVSRDRAGGGKSHFKIFPRILNYGKTFAWGVWTLWKKPNHG